MAKDIFKMDFCNINRFDCQCGRRYINTSNCRQCTTGKQTNADRIRSMTDEEMAVLLIGTRLDNTDKIPFCKNSEECDRELDTGNLIPESWCRKCFLEWLQSESEE